MRIITRLSLALIMFSLFSVSYFVTSAMGEDCAGMGNPAAVASCWDQQNNTPGHPAGYITPADISHCANLEATAARPACEAAAHSRSTPAPFDDGLMGAAGMPGTSAPYMGAPGMAPGMAPYGSSGLVWVADRQRRI